MGESKECVCIYIYIYTHTYIYVCVCDVILAQWRLKSPAIGLFVIQFLKADKKSKLRITGPLCLPVTSGFPAQMATDMWENVMTSWWCILTNINAPYRWPLFLGEIHLRPVVSHHKGQLIGEKFPRVACVLPANILPLKTEGCHNANFVITGDTGFDSLLCRQWRPSWHHHKFKFDNSKNH